MLSGTDIDIGKRVNKSNVIGNKSARSQLRVILDMKANNAIGNK